MASIDTVAVFGAGLMGSGIAQTIAQAGVHVNLADVSEKAVQWVLLGVSRGAEWPCLKVLCGLARRGILMSLSLTKLTSLSLY